MKTLNITIDGQAVEAVSGSTILEAARSVGIYIPVLCYHPDLPQAKGGKPTEVIYQGGRKVENSLHEKSATGCGLCVVEIEGEKEPVFSCSTEIVEGMIVVTDSERIRKKRQQNLIPILARHPHTCLTCSEQEGCSRTQCSSNVPENERCCPQLGHCELQDIANYVGISPDTPRWTPTDLPVLKSEPLFLRDYNLCVGCTRCVRACRDLKGIEAIGFVYDAKGLVQVGSLAPTLKESGCKFCTACVEVCPTGALTDKSLIPGKEKEDLVACMKACPANVDVPTYLRLISQGKPEEANAVIREKVPFPGILGRVCIRPCEEACRRGEVNEAVSICGLKRYAADADQGLWKKNVRVKEETGKKVAVVGAGPSGLSAAFYLRKQGHSVTVFEARSRAGGMMRYGIPRYRLPEDVLDREISEVFELGIDFKPNYRMGRDFTLEGLRDDGFDVVFIGVGAQLSRQIALEGVELQDVLWGVDFLSKVAEGERVRIKEKVIVVGGGSVALDVARTALRCGAQEVTMVCLEKRDEMPAQKWQIEEALQEGVKLITSWGTGRVLSENGEVKGVELIHCVSVFDDQGIFNPTFSEKRKMMYTDQIILAIGQAVDLSFLEEGSAISVKGGLIVVDEKTLETGMRGVYAGGDVTSLAGSIVHAVVAGRKAASSIDKALGGTGNIEEVLFERDAPGQYLGRDEGFCSWPREKMPELELKDRHGGFQEVCLGFNNDQALKEAKRCLQCDLRLYMSSDPSPPQKLSVFNRENISQVPEEEGVFKLYDKGQNVLAIKGTPDLRQELLRALDENEKAAWFDFEPDKMYSKRESELIQKYIQQHGRMPGHNDPDNDLF
ncbi:MAG: FAD-dependent oxidoreductase [Deltaproteobacteria bacterium]|nr:FAD-dependent oxidoreductase [Deltaproteobacteria bacterium]MBW1935127.1 FAD-dependent oxidoreductase [Deltaproteobacteria bacterium]